MINIQTLYRDSLSEVKCPLMCIKDMQKSSLKRMAVYRAHTKNKVGAVAVV